MSLLINGMDMPESCLECPCCFPDDYSSIDLQCGALNILNGKENGVNEEKGILKNCPLSELPTPHGRLIDAEKLLRALAALKYMATVEGGRPTFSEALEEIVKAPTVIEAEE